MTTRRARVAFHEAGHAVIGWLYGHYIREDGIVVHVDERGRLSPHAKAAGAANIKFHLSRPSLASAFPWADSRGLESGTRHFVADVITAIAGLTTEARRFGEQSEQGLLFLSSQDDQALILELVAAYCEATRTGAQEWLGARAAHVKDWLAEDWLQTPLAGRAKDHLGRADVWQAVERTAATLLEKGKLSAAEFRELVHPLPFGSVLR